MALAHTHANAHANQLWVRKRETEKKRNKKTNSISTENHVATERTNHILVQEKKSEDIKILYALLFECLLYGIIHTND